jgi:hypothetical protein
LEAFKGRTNLLSTGSARPFDREGDFVVFRQFGFKLDFPDTVPEWLYYRWLDETIKSIGDLVSGASIVEKESERSEPRRNIGVYYDTDAYRLLFANVILRTTSNPRTHAFCAFKLGEDQDHVRRDHRYVFDGAEKHIIQNSPTSAEAELVVKRLLRRTDILQPGAILREMTGITPDELQQSLCLDQLRRTFYVLLDGKDALRCSLDKVQVRNLRTPSPFSDGARFSEVEIPIYPRVTAEVYADPRLQRLVEALVESLQRRFKSAVVSDSKYRRAAKAVGIRIG